MPQFTTNLLPSSSARCFMQGTKTRGLPGFKWVWGERSRGQVCRLCPQKQITIAGHLSRSLACQASAPCLIDPAGTVSEAGPMGCVLFSFTGSTETGGEIWQGSSFGQQPRSGPCTLFSDLSLLFGACSCCLSALVIPLGELIRVARMGSQRCSLTPKPSLFIGHWVDFPT